MASLRKPLRNSVIFRHCVLASLGLSCAPLCLAAESPLTPRQVFSFLLPLRVFLRVSAAPRQNQSRGFPAHSTSGPPVACALRFLCVLCTSALNPHLAHSEDPNEHPDPQR